MTEILNSRVVVVLRIAAGNQPNLAFWRCDGERRNIESIFFQCKRNRVWKNTPVQWMTETGHKLRGIVKTYFCLHRWPPCVEPIVEFSAEMLIELVCRIKLGRVKTRDVFQRTTMNYAVILLQQEFRIQIAVRRFHVCDANIETSVFNQLADLSRVLVGDGKLGGGIFRQKFQEKWSQCIGADAIDGGNAKTELLWNLS